MKLAGKTALVTGASSGVGRAIAQYFSKTGIRVIGTSRNPESVDWPDGVKGVKLDLSDWEGLDEFWREAGFHEAPPDIVVNNAGAGLIGEFEELEFADWATQVETLLLSPMRLSQLAMQRWSRERPGALVNVSSLAVEYAIPFMCGYNVGKAGLAAFCESLALEVDAESVQVLELRLGDLDTGFSRKLSALPELPEARRVWEVLCAHESKGPKPDVVAEKLLLALVNKRKGVLRVGSFFQTTIASIFGRFLSHRVKRAVNLSYYNLSKD